MTKEWLKKFTFTRHFYQELLTTMNRHFHDLFATYVNSSSSSRDLFTEGDT